MKHKFFFKLLLAIIFCSVNTLSFAADIYLSATGDDGNDGSSSILAVKSFSRAQTLASTGATIYVFGMIDFSVDPVIVATPSVGITLTKNLTIQGMSNSIDGFDGKNLTRFIQTAGFNLTLINLKLTGGSLAAGNGGALNLTGGTINISNVIFDNNKALLGGAIYAAAGTITLDGCTIQNNDNSGIVGSKGGAIYVNMTDALTMNVNNTLIKNNKTASDGAGIYYTDAAAVTGTLKFTNCAFISNVNTATTGAVAAAFAINNATASSVINVSFINTTIYNNTSGGTSGGAGIIVNLRNPSFTSFINCTITNNKTTSGTTSVAGSGIRVLTAVSTNSGIVKFYNSILENNYCTGAAVSATTYTTDFVWQGDLWTAGTHLIIENSMICRPFAVTKYTLANFPNSRLNYLSVISSDVRNSYLAKFGTFNSTNNFVPLLTGSYALNTGLKSHLTSLTPSVTTDQVGNARSGATNCDAGAIEVPKVSITSTSTASTSDNPIPVTITFSNAVTGFDASDITVGNGTKGTLSGSGTTYSLNITPTATGAVTLDIAANAATDGVGIGNVAATQFTRTYAPVGAPPTVIISSTTSSTTQTNPIPVTITFSEAVTGFEVGDLTIGNGSKSNFAGSGTTYTVDITPTVQGVVTIDVAAEVAINGSSTGNTAATRLSRTYYKDIYLSANGNDAYDGFTPATAVLKFSTAQTKAIAGEKIYVSGMVDFSTETQPTGVAISKNLTIQGTSNTTDGFDGKNLTRFLSITNNAVTLKNLKLMNGYSGNNNGGAIIMNTSTGTLSCENVIFDSNKTGMNSEFAAANRTGGAIHISNSYEATFKNCVFSNNEAAKTGAIYISNWAANRTIKFEGCAFVGNIAKESFGGSAIFILTTNDNNTLSMINCTFAKNEVRSGANGGAIYVYKGSANTVTNIINCTVSENTTTGVSATGAGVYMKNSLDGDIYYGKLYIYNSIIEGNKAASNLYSDFSTSEAPTTTTLQINNCLIGKQGSAAVIPTGCFGSQNQFNYLTSTSTTNDYKGGLAPFNTTYNYYPLYDGSEAIGYGNSSYLTGLTPAIITDQFGNTRTVAATNYAGAWESTLIATTTPAAPTTLAATAGDLKASVAFTTAATGGSNVTNYKYSTDGTNFVACSPAKTTSPIVITGLNNDIAYTIKLKAVNANGDSPEITANSVTPRATANDIVVSTPINISTLALTPVSDVVVSGDVLTINQATAINSLTVAPGAKVTVTGTNALTATNGITLQSSESGTATLVDNYTDPTITATVEQYLPQGRNWYVASPIENNIGTAGALTAAGATSVSYYSEQFGWQHSYTGNLTEGIGYVAASNSGTATNKLNFVGKLNSGDVSVTLTKKGSSFVGYNLIANPYPSYINPMMAINANTNLEGTIWYRTRKTVAPYEYKFETVNTTSGVGTNAAGTGMVTGHIPPMQAFWIRTTADNQPFTFTNTMRLHAGNVTVGAGTVPTTALKSKKQESQSMLRLVVTGSTGSDEAVMYFDANASNGFDKYDSRKMFETATVTTPEIYTTVGNEKLTINGLNAFAFDVEMPIGFIAKQAGDFSITGSELTNIESAAHVILKDKLQPNNEIELVAGTVYNFSSQVTEGADRFSLVFKSKGTATAIDNTTKLTAQVFVNAANQITIIAPEKSNYAIYNALGMMLENGVTTSNTQTLNFKLQTGVCFVKVNNVSNRVIIK